MPYEAEIPPIPSRAEELEMITKIEKNFASQPLTRWYPADAERLTNIDIQ